MNLPNYITLFRIFLAPIFFTCLISYDGSNEWMRIAAFTIFLVASLTDALDGYLARKMEIRSKLGRFLDPVADKLLLVSAFLALLYVTALPYRPPLWITVLVVFRDMLILGGLIVIYLVWDEIDVSPNILGKMTTFFQMSTIISILLRFEVSYILWNVMAVITILSCAVYMVREIRRLKGVT